MNRYRSHILIISSSQGEYDHFFKETDKIEFLKNEQSASDYLSKYHQSLDAVIIESHLSKNYRFITNFKDQVSRKPAIIATASTDLLRNYELALSKGADAFIPKTYFSSNENFETIKNIIECHRISSNFEKEHNFKSLHPELRQEFETFTQTFNYKTKVIVLQGEEGAGKRYWLESLGKHFNLVTFDVKKLNENYSQYWMNDVSNQLFIPSNLSSNKKIHIFWGIEYADFFVQNEILNWLKKEENVVFVCTQFEQSFLAQTDYRAKIDIVFTIPSLQERINDLELIITDFLKNPSLCPRHLSFFGQNAKKVFEQEAIELLKEYKWEANIRQLKNVIRQSICNADLQSAGRISKDHLPISIKIRNFPINFHISREETELRSWLDEFIQSIFEGKVNNNDLPFTRLRRINVQHPHLLAYDVKKILGLKLKLNFKQNVVIFSAPNSNVYKEKLKVQLSTLFVKMIEHPELDFLQLDPLEISLILAILCPELINMAVFRYLEQYSDFQKLVLIKAKPISDKHLDFPLLKQILVLPRDEKSIHEFRQKDIDTIIRDIADDIVTKLNLSKSI